MIDEKHTWNILGDFLKTKGVVSHQIDSFNDFLNTGIQRVIDEEPDINISPKKGQKYTVKFGQVYIPKPSIIEEDRTSHKIFPSEARIRDLTLDSPIHLDITTILEDVDYPSEITHHNRVMIGRIPIMLGSDRCNLADCTPMERIQAGECEWDPGGYFIIRGKERVLVSQLRGVYNKPLVFKQKEDCKWKYICEIRSMSEETGHSVLIKAMIGVDDRTIVFSLPYINQPIPVGIVLKALGYTEDDIIDLIGLKGKKAEWYLKLINRDCHFIDSKEDALKYIGQYTMHIIKDDKKIDYSWQVIETELFPHMGISSTVKEKAYFLGIMINKLLSTSLGYRAEDDKDDWKNKRVESAGTLCRELFRPHFKRYIKYLTLQLGKKKVNPNIMTIISRTNTITTGLRHCFSTGNWGVQKNSYIRTGVSQVLSRLTYGATLSHLRRIVIPVGKEGKNSKIRQIHSSQVMYICPTETPEGQPVGIVLNYALLTIVSKRVSTLFIKELIEKCDNIVMIDDFEDKNVYTKVLVNGILLGMTKDPYDLKDEIEELRIANKVQLSVTYDDVDNEVIVQSDEGRVLRPVYTVKDNALTIKKSDGTVWDDLVEKDVIRYIDNLEAESSVIAMDQEELGKWSNNFCEIHPTMIMGVMGNAIPYPDHSQAPRNCYQSAMGKQAMGVFAQSYNIRTDTIVHVLDYPQRPYVSTSAAKLMGFEEMPAGQNAIVGISTYGGWNQEDSVVMNQSSIERGLFGAWSLRTLTDVEKKHGTYNFETICLPSCDIRHKNSNYSLLDEDGIVRTRINNRSVHVKKGDVIIGKVLTKSNKNSEETFFDCSIIIKNGEEGIIDKVIVTITPNGYKLIKVVIRVQRTPEVGDKFASRSAQKGTIGATLPQIDMPFSSSGMTPDIIINPHAFPSRMTINHLMECITGKSCAMEGTFADATAFSESSKQGISIICDRLAKHGFERHGWEKLCDGRTGEQIDSLIFMGPTNYQRLKHMVSDKIHARAEGHVTTLTRQPLEGTRQPVIFKCQPLKIKSSTYIKLNYIKIKICIYKHDYRKIRKISC